MLYGAVTMPNGYIDWMIDDGVKVDIKTVEKLGKDFLALFDSLWTIGDDERLETLMNLKHGKVKVKK